jgi:hypothetical protein
MHGSPLDWWFERCRRAHAFARTRLPVYTIIGRPPTCLRQVPKSLGRTGSVDAYDGRALEISRYPLFKPDPRKAYCAPAILGGQHCSGGEIMDFATRAASRSAPKILQIAAAGAHAERHSIRSPTTKRRRRARGRRQDRTRIRPICNGCCQDGGALRPSQAHLPRAARAGHQIAPLPPLQLVVQFGASDPRLKPFALSSVL